MIKSRPIKNDNFVLKLGDERNSISLKASTFKKPDLKKPKTQITIEMTSAILDMEKEAIRNGKSIWPMDIEMESSGRLRNIEADSETIEEIEEWANSKGMNCL